jgi:hypothetical protein
MATVVEYTNITLHPSPRSSESFVAVNAAIQQFVDEEAVVSVQRRSYDLDGLDGYHGDAERVVLLCEDHLKPLFSPRQVVFKSGRTIQKKKAKEH